MNIDLFPMPVIFVLTMACVYVMVEVGYRVGGIARRKSENEKESPVSAIAGAILALTGFILAFAFGIATDRFDARRALVRDEANVIRTAYSRADFLPDSARVAAKDLLRAYAVQRVAAVKSMDPAVLARAVEEAENIQHQLWNMAVRHAYSDLDSDVAALYIESLNDLSNIHATRMAVAWQYRIPAGVWQVLCLLVGLGMFGLGYQAAIAGSLRSWAAVLLAFSFSLVILLIVALDRPQGSFIHVTQQPLEDVRNWMDGSGAR